VTVANTGRSSGAYQRASTSTIPSVTRAQY
jgi:hypothetical protein